MNLLDKIKEKVKVLFQDKPHKKHPWLWGIGAVVLFISLYLLSSLGGLRVFLPHLPELTGLPFSSKNYLIVFQNNHELRPAGGFVSSFGIVKFRNGIFTGLDVQDVYGNVDNHPYIDPPYPMQQLLSNQFYKGYTFRDANYWADFPQSAVELTKMIHLTQPNLQIDGVIAINYSFLEDLLGAVGGVDVDGKNFTQESLFSMLENAVNNVDRHNVEDLLNRKNILKDFAQRLIKKIALSPLKLRKVSDTIFHSLATKEIQLNFTNPSLQKMADDNSWSGRWPQNIKGDFLAVVEANLGGMKSDRYIQRMVKYHVKQQDDPDTGDKVLVGEVTIDIDHYGIENVPMNGEYTGFFKTYVPKGAKLLDAKSDNPKSLWNKDEGQYTVFGNVVRLSPGEHTQLYYKYQLPKNVLLSDNEYQVYMPKQSGTDQDYYSVIFEAPEGYRIDSPHFQSKENVGIYQQELFSDVELYLKFIPDKLSPNVIYQNIEALNKITIVFNENISDAEATNPFNFELKDLNVNHKEVTDSLQIDHIEHQGKAIIIYTKNMTKQPEEHYQVVMKNISNSLGDMTSPNPKTITLVQRLNN